MATKRETRARDVVPQPARRNAKVKRAYTHAGDGLNKKTGEPLKTKGAKPSGNTARDQANRLKEQDSLVKQGRPMLLTPETANKIVSYIRQGNYTHVAAVASGVSERTFQHWMHEGNKEDAVEPYKSFCDSIKEAEATSEILTVALIRNQVQDNWTAGMTWLERRFKKRWSRQDNVVHETPDGKPFQIEATSKLKIEDLTLEQKKLLLQLSSTLVETKGD